MGTVGYPRRLLRTATLIGVAFMLVGVPFGASANPDIDGFELEGNAVVDSSAKADWNGLPGGSLFFTGFRTDPTDDTDTGYASGLTKDTADISSWTWENADVTPAKSDILNDYAAVFEEDGNLILYFGQNRQLDENGDANVGFWFLQNEVGLEPDGTFSGVHAEGDILVQSEFTNGGDVSGIRIGEWRGGALVLLPSGAAECTSGKLGTNDACAIVNTDKISTSWAGDLTAPYFFEGGLNLSALFPEETPCFSTFLTNTRTSQAENADLKDFGIGAIDTCAGIKISKTANPSDGTQFDYTTTGDLSPSGFALTDGATQAYDKLGPGSYSVTEAAPSGAWSLDSVSCPTVSGPGTSVQIDGATVNITLGSLGNVECTYVNQRQPKLTLVKEVVKNNGGTALPSAWTLTAEGPTGFSGLGPSVSSDADFDQGSYNLSESGPAGYDASEWDCTGESQVDADTVTVGLGDEITCTITNDDQAASLIVRKVVVNDNGGTRRAQDFSFQVNGGTAQPFEADAQNDLIVAAGSYNVTEPALAGYTTSYSNCSNLVIANGGSATCTVTNNDVPPGQGSISVSKSANPTTLKEPGGPVTFSVTITNTSLDVLVTIDNVVDDKFGDLDDSGGNGCFDVPINLAPGASVNCTFQKQITGVGGTTHVNVVTVSGHDPAGHQLTASDDARVDITPRLIDLVIVKEASSPTPLNGIVNYSLSVTNRGPDTATDVQVADPAPAGITYLSASPSQGSCSLGPSLITCSLGTIAPGQTVTIAITARATTVGSHTNTATVTGAGGRETNPADNVDSAVTVVPAPLKPPVVKPASPQLCLTLAVSPQMIKADGKPDKVSVRVTAGSKRMKGVKVVVSGAGVRKSASSNSKGVAVLRINPKKAGIITITALEPDQQVCGPKRIGVVGVFLPPLTG